MKQFQINIIEHTDNLYHAIDNLLGIEIIIKKTADSYDGELINQDVPICTARGDDLEFVSQYLFSELGTLIIKHMFIKEDNAT